MSEAFSNSNPSAYSSPTVQPAGTGVASTPMKEQVPAGQTNVPIGEVSNTSANGDTLQTHFDSETQPISPTYARKYLSGLNNQSPSTYYPDADADVCFGTSLNNPKILKGGYKEDARQLGFKPLGISGYGFLGQFKTNAYYAELRATAEALSTENSIVKPTKNGFIRYLLDENGNIMPSMGIEVDKNGIEIPFTDNFPDLVPSLHVLSR